MSDLQKKIPFMASVFGHLIFQLFVMFQGTKNKVPESQRFLYWGASIVLLFTLTLARFSLPVKVMLFTAMAYIVGMIMNEVKDAREALIETATIFACMFIAGVLTVQMGYKLNTLGLVLFVALLGVLIARLMKPNRSYGKILSIIFALLVLYDTNSILQKNYGGNYVNASLDYFLDIETLFRLAGSDE
tara:strand:+ start:583 stop:1146 length:564 start_codon:yes stop_codon:yes gene_type:complete